MIKAYIQQLGGFKTLRVQVKQEPMRHHVLGLQYTATGYGKRIPTEYMIKINNRWRRVYCAIYSNIGTLYYGKLSDRNFVTIQSD